jgi:hypothetical protein
MTQPPPPVVVQKKRGPGCFGCGCLVLLVAIILLVGGGAGVFYLLHTKGMAVTATTPAPVPTFDGGDALYSATVQKTNAFGQALQQNQPTTLELTADEINTIIARSPNLAASQVHAFITMTGNVARIQAAVPTNLLPGGMLKDRYLNVDFSFTPGFDPDSKNVSVNLQSLQFGSDNIPKENLTAMQSELEPLLNIQLQRDPNIQRLLNQAKSIEVRDGKLEIATQ